MAVRQSTKQKYMAVAARLREHLAQYGEIDARLFTLENNVAAAFVRDMEDAGFVIQDRHQMVWLDKEITERNMQPVFDKLATRSQTATDRRNARIMREKREAANDPALAQHEMAQEPLDFQRHKPRGTSVPASMEQQFQDLERRVAALEQLLIRRGVA